MERRESPCLECTRVLDTENCMDKTCRVWQDWFLEQWELSRQAIRAVKDGPAEPVGVPLGGERYAMPHQVEDYLQADPCTVCRCHKNLCKGSCRKRRAWERSCEELGR